MKTLILLVVVGVCGYFAYQTWFPAQAADDKVGMAELSPAEVALRDAEHHRHHFEHHLRGHPAQAQGPAAPEPVEFAVKVRVRRLIEEWKNRSAGSAGAGRRPSMTDIESEISDIRQRLYDKGLHDEKSLKELMTRAAVELGHMPDQAQFLIGKILAAGQSAPRFAQPVGGIVPEAPEPPASRMRSVGGGN